MKKLKQIYAKWLFDKYGFDRGPLFENIPMIYKINPLWSPSCYGNCEGEQFAEWFKEGLEKGLKNTIKINFNCKGE